jgi:hypothetical protein
MIPYMEEFEEKGIVSRELARRARKSAITAIEGLFELPGSMNAILSRFSAGALTFDIADADMHRFQVIVDRASDRILAGFVTAALVIGCSVVIFASRQTIGGFVLLLAYAGFIAAVFLGILALYYSIRE